MWYRLKKKLKWPSNNKKSMKDSNIYLIKSFGADSMRMVNKKANKQTPKLKTKQNIFIVSSMLRF